MEDNDDVTSYEVQRLEFGRWIASPGLVNPYGDGQVRAIQLADDGYHDYAAQHRVLAWYSDHDGDYDVIYETPETSSKRIWLERLENGLTLLAVVFAVWVALRYIYGWL